MTDNAQELEAKLMEVIESHFKPTDNSLMPLNATKRIVHLIQQEIAKARIDELNRIQLRMVFTSDKKYVSDRIAELSQTLKEHKEAK